MDPTTGRDEDRTKQGRELTMDSRHNRSLWKLPRYYWKPGPMPCPECGWVFLANGARAARLTRSGKEIARFRCGHCGHTWCLPVREMDPAACEAYVSSPPRVDGMRPSVTPPPAEG